jgi:hypothetical protein
VKEVIERLNLVAAYINDAIAIHPENDLLYEAYGETRIAIKELKEIEEEKREKGN